MDKVIQNLIIEKIVSVASIYTEAGVRVKKKNRPYWAILIKYEGETEYYVGNKKTVSNINNMVVLPKGSEYEWYCVESGHYYVIEFDSPSTCQQLISFPVSDGKYFLRKFQELEYRRMLNNETCQMECVRDTYSILLKLIKNQMKYIPSVKVEKLSPVMDYILANYTKKIRNEDLANIIGVSTVYFRKLFTETYHVSPMKYIKQLRIIKAEEMLKTDYGSISEIATSLGYPTVYDFSRDFKKNTELSPSNYVKMQW